jgi:hypothetical protein
MVKRINTQPDQNAPIQKKPKKSEPKINNPPKTVRGKKNKKNEKNIVEKLNDKRKVLCLERKETSEGIIYIEEDTNTSFKKDSNGEYIVIGQYDEINNIVVKLTNYEYIPGQQLLLDKSLYICPHKNVEILETNDYNDDDINSDEE